jgi:hypothetical protein
VEAEPTPVKAPIADLADFAALAPFFRIIEKGLEGLAGPGHFFDLLAGDITTEYVITVPGYPARDREVVRWRDYLNPVAVFEAIGWPQR